MFFLFKNKILKIVLSIVIIFQNNVIIFAQNEASSDMMRSMGKINVVVAVIISIFIGMFYYLYRLDKKLSNLENQLKSNNE